MGAGLVGVSLDAGAWSEAQVLLGGNLETDANYRNYRPAHLPDLRFRSGSLKWSLNLKIWSLTTLQSKAVDSGIYTSKTVLNNLLNYRENSCHYSHK